MALHVKHTPLPSIGGKAGWGIALDWNGDAEALARQSRRKEIRNMDGREVRMEGRKELEGTPS